MGAAGVSTGQETWSPSSNDWDYTYDGSGEWPAAGNTLGDDSGGGFIYTNGGDSMITSLFTFDGDLEITFTLGLQGTANTIAFGLIEITEDDNRGTNDGRDFYGSGVKSFVWWDGNPGGGADAFYYGNTNEGSHTYSDGDSVKITRESGTIKFYDGSSVEHTFSSTSTNPVRFFFGSGGGSGHNIDNILFTDSEGVQRDGFINEGTSTARGWGGSGNERYYGFAFKPTRTGKITEVKGELVTHTSNFNSNCTVYTENSAGTNPDSLLATSATLALSSAGTKTWTFSTPATVNKGTWYWIVFSDLDGGSGNTNFVTIGNYGDDYFKSGKQGSIGAIADASYGAGHLGDLKVEVKIETTEEPTPDHDTLLLISSDTSDGSTTFVDRSPRGATISASGNVQHDTAQTLGFGSSSMLFDGSGDWLQVPDAGYFDLTGTAWTIECRFRLASTGTEVGLINKDGPGWDQPWSIFIETGGGRSFSF